MPMLEKYSNRVLVKMMVAELVCGMELNGSLQCAQIPITILILSDTCHLIFLRFILVLS